MDNTQSDALILLGHGTTLNPDSSAAVIQHAENLRNQRVFGEVYAAFWKQEPKVQDVIARVAARRVVIVPMFISEGYFSQQVIPQALGFPGRPDSAAGTRICRQNDRTLYYTEPVGTHPGMTRVLLQRAEEVVRRFPFPVAPAARDTTLFIAGHGTEQNANSRAAVERQVEKIRQLGAYAETHAIFMEEEPLIKNWRALTLTRKAVVVPFFISEGLHVAEDIPVMLGASGKAVKERLASGQPPWRNPTEKDGVLVWYASSAGTSPLVADIIIERARQAAAMDV